MNITIHDAFGHVSEAIESASTPHGHAHDHPVMRHLALRAEVTSMTPHDVLIDALTGRDSEAVRLATDLNDRQPQNAYDRDVIAALSRVCGGIDANVAVTLAPFLDNECSIEGDDGSGVAWNEERIDIQPVRPHGDGEILRSDGKVFLGMEMSHTVAAAASGRRLSEVIDLPCMPADRRIVSIDTGDGETMIHLAA